MAVQQYTVRVTWWSRQGWDHKDVKAEGSRPSVAIHQALRLAEFNGAVRSGIAGATIIEGPPGFKGLGGVHA